MTKKKTPAYKPPAPDPAVDFMAVEEALRQHDNPSIATSEMALRIAEGRARRAQAWVEAERKDRK